MDAWMDELMDEWVDGWMDGQLDGQIYSVATGVRGIDFVFRFLIVA